MAKTVQSQQRHRRSLLLSIPMIVTIWQVRRTWFMLLFITMGMVAAVMIASAIPLLSDVMLTAGLRSTLRATPQSSEITLSAGTNGISTPIEQSVHTTFDSLFHQYLGNTIQPVQSSLISSDFSFSPMRKNQLLTVYGTSISQAAPYLDNLQGHLAQAISNAPDQLEVMLTPDTAKALSVKVGSTFNMSMNYVLHPSNSTSGSPAGSQQYTVPVTAHVVGIFSIAPSHATYWYGQDFKTMNFGTDNVSISRYTLLVPDNAMLALYDSLRARYHTDAVHTLISSEYTFLWHYRLDVSRFSINDLDALINNLDEIQATISANYADLSNNFSSFTLSSYPYLSRVELSGTVFTFNANSVSNLEQFRSRISVVRIPSGVFTLLILALLLFFVSLMTSLLVDRQADTIAILRSRGASSAQIFGALLLESIVLGAIALVLGLPLSLYATVFLAQHLLPTSTLDALNSITNHPRQVLSGTFWYGCAIVLVALLTMSISLFFVARTNVLSQRREAARSNKRPLWQRFNLDVIIGAIALASFALSLYVRSIGTDLQGDANVLLATPILIIAPFFLVLACLLLFLRVFPWFLQWGVHLSRQGRGAVSLLALAQIARSPRQSIRMSMLLALATAFAVFTLVFSATQAQHIQQIVNYQTGADISGEVASGGLSTSQYIHEYQAIPGVLSASAGWAGKGYGGTANLAMDVRAVDAASFGQTVIWPSEKAYLAARPFLAELVTLRGQVASSDTVPAIVDTTTFQRLRLHVGSAFTVTLNDIIPQKMQCELVGVVDSIPTLNNFVTVGSGQQVSGGVLVDYQTYANAYTRDATQLKLSGNSTSPPFVTTIWLHTKDDPTSLASVRVALNTTQLRLTNVVDRRLLLATLLADPLYLVLDGVLLIGTLTALLMALVGDLLASWLGARTRLLGFVTLRAFGMTLRQIISMLMWEQGIIYSIGIVLGGGLGMVLAIGVIPQLTFTDLNSNLNSQQFYALQSALATQIVVPSSLPLVLLLLAGICAIALVLMVLAISQPTLNQVLRMNED